MIPFNKTIVIVVAVSSQAMERPDFGSSRYKEVTRQTVLQRFPNHHPPYNSKAQEQKVLLIYYALYQRTYYLVADIISCTRSET